MRKLLIIVFLFCFASIYAARNLSTPNPSPEAVNVYNYLKGLKGQKILSGQMWAPYGGDELNYIQSVTGKLPAVRGGDFITQADNANEVQYAKDWWAAGGIPTIMWHWGAPTKGEGYDAAKMSINVANCFVSGTAEYTAFWSELKIKADLLQQLRDAKVPVLWRPFHELNGGWFWWGMGGSANFKKLWTTMYNYFVTTRGLNNLIWVLCYTGSPDAAWYPGDAYVDIAGGDTYTTDNGAQTSLYNAVKTIVNDQVPICMHECGTPPDPNKNKSEGSMWSWWMEWHTDWLKSVSQSYLKSVYSNSLIVTRDQVPNLKNTCTATAIVPYLTVNGGTTWTQTSTATVASGTSVILGPQPSTGGSWSWSGLASGTARQVTIVPTSSGTATATYTNACGSKSTQNFVITVTGSTSNCGTCNWYGTTYPVCCNTASGWGWENNASCISKATCTGSGQTCTSCKAAKIVTDINQSNTTAEPLSAFPVPVANEFSLRFESKSTNAFVSIYNIEGKLVYSEKLSTIEGLNDKKYSASQINMNVKGVYVIQLITAEGVQKLKVIKK